jgi:hypothetical protein
MEDKVAMLRPAIDRIEESANHVAADVAGAAGERWVRSNFRCRTVPN